MVARFLSGLQARCGAGWWQSTHRVAAGKRGAVSARLGDQPPIPAALSLPQGKLPKIGSGLEGLARDPPCPTLYRVGPRLPATSDLIPGPSNHVFVRNL